MTAGPSSPDNDGRAAGSAAGAPRSRSRSTLLMGCAAALVLAVSLFGGHDTSSGSDARSSGSAPASAQPSRSAEPPTRTAGQPSVRALPRSKPVRLRIPKILVDAPFTDLSIGSSGQLDPPPADDVNLVGWFAKGASPGEAGTSIVAGHVDTKTAPAVFVGLGELKKGDVFHIDRADGRTATFVVDSAETFSKDDFPSERVYADTPQPQVRLITCAGDYDRSARDYTDNLVVFAHLK